MRCTLFLLMLSSMIATTNAEPLSGQSALQKLLTSGKCHGCDLRYADLSNRQLMGASLVDANLTGAKLDNTNLRGADLRGATLRDVTLTSTKLAGAKLQRADLSDTNIDQAFEYVEITGTRLEGARFKYGVVCGPPPTRGGWGCQHADPAEYNGRRSD